MRFIPLIVVAVLIAIGFTNRFRVIRLLDERLRFTHDYGDEFVKFLEAYLYKSEFDPDLYIKLVEKSVKMQSELGVDGVVDVIDKLKGVKINNYQLLLNFFAELRESQQWQGMSLIHDRLRHTGSECIDMFIRHSRRLTELIESERKHLLNPFTCLAYGVRWILWLPANILLWCGFISTTTDSRLKNNWLVKVLAFIVTIIGLASSVVSVAIGWEQFINTVTNWLS